jgi:hypothetical protein
MVCGINIAMTMSINEYQVLALLTEHTPDFVRLKNKEGVPYSDEHNMIVARSIHACSA